LGADTPWHISRFHPTYRLTDRPATPLRILQQAGEIGRQAGLHYVYLGNVHSGNGESTQCPQCGMVLMDRRGFQLDGNYITDDRCPQCGMEIYGVGMSG
jgi:pyruvate formate lyase activating enzyme